MNDAERIYEIRDRLESEDRTKASECISILEQNAEQLLGFAQESVISTVRGEKPGKPENNLEEAKAALRTLHDYGERLDLPVPAFDDDREFLTWLLNNYLRSMLH